MTHSAEFAKLVEAAEAVDYAVSAVTAQEFALLNFVHVHSAEIAAALAAMPGWKPIESAPKDGSSVILGYERTADLPEPWPLVIIGHWAKEGHWVWQGRAARGYGVGPIKWQPPPASPAPEEK